MRTFEEALAVVCRTFDKESEDSACLKQQEFRSDVFTCEPLAPMIETFIQAMHDFPEDGVAEDEISAQMLVMMALNCVCLGVTIGVQMERSDIEPKPKLNLWKRVRALVFS